MKIIVTLILLATFMPVNNNNTPGTIHDFTMTDIRGQQVKLESFKGKAVLIVNTASKCGFTPQYKDLQDLYSKYEDEDFVILGFPANNFGGQEPGSDEEIAEFCELNFGVRFPMFSKVEVRGSDIHPFFEFITNLDNPDFTGNINWNFEKFLFDKDGTLLRRFRSRTSPMSNEIIGAIETILGK